MPARRSARAPAPGPSSRCRASAPSPTRRRSAARSSPRSACGRGHRPTSAWPPRSVVCPTSSSKRSGAHVPGSTSIGPIEPETAVVFGSGPGWAAALEAALLLKEVALVPAEGVETREGATSAMMALGPEPLALSLPAGVGDDPLLAEAEEICAGQGATVLRAPGGETADRRLAAVSAFPAAAALSRPTRHRARPRRRPARLDRRVLPRRETSGMSLGLGVIGCGSVFAGPYRAMIERLRSDGRVHVSAVYDVDDAKRRGAAAHYDVDPELRDPDAVARRRRRRRRPRADEHERARPPREGGARGGEARARREADGDVPRGGGGAARARADVGEPARLRAARPAQPHVPRRARSGARRPGSASSSPHARATAGPARGGASGSTSQAAGRSSTLASTTSRASAPCSGPRGG